MFSPPANRTPATAPSLNIDRAASISKPDRASTHAVTLPLAVTATRSKPAAAQPSLPPRRHDRDPCPHAVVPAAPAPPPPRALPETATIRLPSRTALSSTSPPRSRPLPARHRPSRASASSAPRPARDRHHPPPIPSAPPPPPRFC